MDYHSNYIHLEKEEKGFPGGLVVRSLPFSTGDTGLIPGPGGSRML